MKFQRLFQFEILIYFMQFHMKLYRLMSTHARLRTAVTRCKKVHASVLSVSGGTIVVDEHQRCLNHVRQGGIAVMAEGEVELQERWRALRKLSL